MPIIELSTALVAAGSGLVVPFVNKVLEKSAQRLGGHVDEHLAALFTRAHDHLAATGREPQAVEAKIAIPLLQAAALETDPTLTEKWAALLANAADPVQRVQVRVGFTETLRQLTAIDARVIVLIYQEVLTQDAAAADSQPVWTSQFEEKLEITRDELLMSVEELVRLKLCDANFVRFTKLLDEKEQERVNTSVYRTIYGQAFLAAVTPPTA